MEKVNYDIILLSPPSRMINHYRPPLALIHIGGFLKSKGLEVKVIDVPMRDVVRTKRFWREKDGLISKIQREMIRQVRATPTRYLGISCYSPEFEEVRELICQLREVSKAKIIVGGIHPTLCPEDFKDIADYTVRGLGEVATYWIITGEYPKVKDFDEICVPDYSLVDMDYYTNANPYAIRGVFIRPGYLLAGYGCPSSCSFCVAPALRPFWGTHQRRSAPSLIGTVATLKNRFLVDGFYFIDDLFTLDKENVREFCELLIRCKLNLIWGCSAKVTTLNEDLIKLMARSGCVQMDFGVERGSDEELRRLKKGQTIAQIDQTFAWCRKYKVRTFANYLIGVAEENLSKLQDIRRSIKRIRPDIVSVNIFENYKGTRELPSRFKFSTLERWRDLVSRRFNKMRQNIPWKVQCVIFKSKRKLNYLAQLWLLIRELINQKFGGI